MDKKAAGQNGAAAVRLDLRFLLFRLHLFEGLAERGIAVGEQAYSLHDLVIGGVLTGMLDLVCQLLQLMGMGGVVAGHVLHQGQQLLHRLALAMRMVMMLVLMGVGVLMGMGVGLAIGMGVLVAVDMGMLMVVGMVVIFRVGMGVLMLLNALVGMGGVVVVMIVNVFVVIVKVVVVHVVNLLKAVIPVF